MTITSTSTFRIDTQTNFICIQICTVSKQKKFTCNSCKKCPKHSLLSIFLGKESTQEITQYYTEELVCN